MRKNNEEIRGRGTFSKSTMEQRDRERVGEATSSMEKKAVIYGLQNGI
jgi:nitrogenase molybdenum-iron protein alpha/beta subunit